MLMTDALKLSSRLYIMVMCSDLESVS